jgi:hypothetical protein
MSAELSSPEDRQPSSRDENRRTAVEVIEAAPSGSTVVFQPYGPAGVTVPEEEREALVAEMADRYPHVRKFKVTEEYGPASSARVVSA